MVTGAGVGEMARAAQDRASIRSASLAPNVTMSSSWCSQPLQPG